MTPQPKNAPSGLRATFRAFQGSQAAENTAKIDQGGPQDVRAGFLGVTWGGAPARGLTERKAMKLSTTQSHLVAIFGVDASHRNFRVGLLLLR